MGMVNICLLLSFSAEIRKPLKSDLDWLIVWKGHRDKAEGLKVKADWNRRFASCVKHDIIKSTFIQNDDMVYVIVRFLTQKHGCPAMRGIAIAVWLKISLCVSCFRLS